MKSKKLPPPHKRCQKDAGTPEQCRAARLYDSEYCIFHDPAARRDRADLERLDRLPLARASDIHRLLAWTLRAVRKRRMDPQRAYAIGWLVRLLVENQPALEAERVALNKQSNTRARVSEVMGLEPQWRRELNPADDRQASEEEETEPEGVE